MTFSSFIALGVGILIGGAMAMAIGVSVPKADAGDWLSFAGALVGVVVTIVGTLWLEHHRSGRQEREDKRVLGECLTDLRDSVVAASEPRGDREVGIERPERVELEQRLLNQFEKFEYAKHFVPSRNADAWQKAERLYERLRKVSKLVEHELQLIKESGDSEPVLAINIDKMISIRDDILPLIDDTISAVR